MPPISQIFSFVLFFALLRSFFPSYDFVLEQDESFFCEQKEESFYKKILDGFREKTENKREKESEKMNEKLFFLPYFNFSRALLYPEFCEKAFQVKNWGLCCEKASREALYLLYHALRIHC